MTNLFISYDLMTQGKDYTAVQKAIKSLGWWRHVQLSQFYVHTHLTEAQATAIVWAAMDSNDRLTVVTALSASMPHLLKADIDAINQTWNAPAKAA